MHYHVESVVRAVRSAQPDGQAGYLRIKADADRGHARAVLIEERDAAQAEVEKLFNQSFPSALLTSSQEMQMLIVTMLLLEQPDQPVDLGAVNEAQLKGRSSILKQSLEAVANDLAGFFGRTFEIIEQL